MTWLFEKLFSLFDSRFIKSISRYLIAGAIGALFWAAGVLPEWASAIPQFKEAFEGLAGFLELHQETLAEIIATFLTGILALWSYFKNKANQEVEKLTGRKTK